MKNAIILSFVLTVLFPLWSCEDKQDEFITGVVKDYGDPALDGCGWVIMVSSNVFKPLELPIQYHENDLEVLIKYDLLNSKANCGFALEVYENINVKEIRKK